MAGDRLPNVDRRSFLKATGAAGSAAALGGVASGDGPNDGSESLVGLSADVDMDQFESSLPGSVEVLDRYPALNFLLVRKPGNTYQAMSASAEIQNMEEVKYDEDNREHQALEVPNDDRFDGQYAPQQVGAPTAWDTTFGSDTVTVAIVDQGVKYDHPDLQSRFGSNKGRDFVDGDGDPYPVDFSNEYHGTHVAGIAAATTDNNEGVAGISDSRLLSCRALGAQGGGSTADIADAVRWATDQGADIINMSLGGGGYTETMKNAVSYAVNNGALPICAAGNDGSSSVSYPAAYDECVSVSAVDENEDLASFSQYGPNNDVAAPGVDVLSTWTTSSQPYNRISGTSMACPAASGVAALGLAADSTLGPNELRQRLKETAVDIGLSDQEQGAGRVDAANIVGGGGGGNDSPSASISVSDSSVEPGTDVTFDGTDSSDPDGSIASYDWDFGDGTTASGSTATHSYSSSGDYNATLTVTDDAGATDSASTTISVSSSGGGGGTCGDATETASVQDSLSGSGDSISYEYTAQLSEPCGLTLDLTGDSGTDFDLYVTLDGRTPTTTDYDKRSYNYGSDESITLGDTEFDAGQTVGILVDSYSGSGSFTLSLTEEGTGSGGGGGNDAPTADVTASASTVVVGDSVSFDGSGSSDPDGSIASYDWDFGDGSSASGQTASHAWSSTGTYTVTLTVTDDAGATDSASTTITVESEPNEGPVADFTASASTVVVGDSVSFDGSGSSDPDGSIASYDWSFGDGSSASGQTASHAWSSAGDYTVTLTVTDDAGATDSASATITVESDSGGGDCGTVSETASADGSLSSYYDEDPYSYPTQLSDPCQLTVELSGPSDADFDLYVTTDGRTPSPYDYDKRSATVDSQEQIILENVDGSTEIGILVDSYSGSGGYTLTVTELGR